MKKLLSKVAQLVWNVLDLWNLTRNLRTMESHSSNGYDKQKKLAEVSVKWWCDVFFGAGQEAFYRS